jgi:predicted ATPase/DNA-binding CsgD family transcriptional regulator
MKESVRAPGNLPAQITSFVGRRNELAQVKKALREHRLVSIVGPGGAGKTRLAVETADQLTRSFPGGIWFIDLGKHPAHRAILDHVASTMRLAKESGKWSIGELAARLQERQVLLVLDTCEHVVEEVADFVQRLLSCTSTGTVLTTSRQALSVGGEQLIHLDGLEFPAPRSPDAAADLAGVESVVLFLERGRSIVSDLRLTDENAAAVADIVRRLEGLPLAIELAAARLRVLAPQQIASRLENQFRLLKSSRVPTERHQTLLATIQWSHDFCSLAERLCWARLSTFPADFDLDAAQAVAVGGDIDRDGVLDLVAALIDKSILRTTARHGRPTRYRFSDPVRDFGRDALAQLDPAGMAWSRHLEHFNHLVASVPELLFGPDQVRHLDMLRTEQANLDAALLQALSEREMDAADSLACAIALVSFSSGSLSEASHALSTAADRDGNRSTARVRLLWLSAWLAINQGEVTLARDRASQSRRLAQLIDDRGGMVHALQYLGQAELLANDVGAADRDCRRAVHLAREVGEDHLLATSLVRYAQVLEAVDQYDDAKALLEESVAISDRVGETWCRGFALWNLALLMQATGRPDEGATRARAVLDSKALFEDVVGVAQGLEAMAWCLADLGDAAHAAVLLGAAETIWVSTGAALPVRLLTRRDICEQSIAARIGAERYAQLRRDGRDLTPERAIAWAERGVRPPAPVPAAPAAATATTPVRQSTQASLLTPREREVAFLVADGLKNREIAQRLVISPRTAEAHIEHILAKLGFNSRAQISSWAAYQSGD